VWSTPQLSATVVVLRGKVHSKELTLVKQKQRLEVNNDVDEDTLLKEKLQTSTTEITKKGPSWIETSKTKSYQG
jgi:hypothetical protein